MRTWRRTFRTPLRFGSTELRERRGWWLSFADDEGRWGVGDCAPLPGFHTGTFAQNAAALHRLVREPSWANRAASCLAVSGVDATLALLDAWDWLSPAARAALETALDTAFFDTARTEFLDATLQVNAVVGDRSAGALGGAFEEAHASGAQTLKLKCAGPPTPAWIDALARASEQTPSLRLRIDANQSWGETDVALRSLEAVARAVPAGRIEYVEEPAAAPDWPALLSASPLPLGIDESLPFVAPGLLSALHISAPLRPTALIKPSAVGGPWSADRIARDWHAVGAGVVVTTLLDSEVGVAMAARVAARVDQRAGVRRAHGLSTLGLFTHGGAFAPTAKVKDVGVAHALEPPPAAVDPTQVDWAATHAALQPHAEALVTFEEDGTRRSYAWADLGRAADALSAQMEGHRVVGLREAPAPAVWALLLAAWRTGVCVVGVHPRRSPVEQDVQLAEVGASLCMERDGRLHALSGASLAEPVGSSFVAPPPLAASPPLAALERWLYEVGDLPSEPALILFTSGTTGRPKAARLSRRAVAASAVAHAVHSQGYTYAGWLLCMPAWHVGGWSVFLRAMIQGTRVVVSEPFEPRIVARRLREEAVGGVSFVPTMLHRLLEAGEAAPSSLRIALVGGAASPPGLLERARAAGWPVAPTWGLTECASQVATASPAAAGPNDGALLVPGFEIRARGESDEGELLVRGPQCFDGYLQPDGSIDRSAFDADGFFATGDLGRVLDRPHGRCVEVWNRRVDLIVSGGENVYPAEVERRLLALPGVREAAVVGLDDAEWGQVVAAVVVPDGPDATVAGLDALARATFPGFLRPKRWHLSASLPVGPTGKRDTAALRALFAATGGETGGPLSGTPNG